MPCCVQDEAESGCEVDWTSGKRDGPDCGKLDSFESLVRQLLGQAPMKSFAHMLYTLRKADQHAQQPSGTTLHSRPEMMSDKLNRQPCPGHKPESFLTSSTAVRI